MGERARALTRAGDYNRAERLVCGRGAGIGRGSERESTGIRVLNPARNRARV